MKTKFLLPVLAMIFAVGMSFTTVNTSKEDVTGYILISPGNWQPVTVDCSGQDKCLVRYEGETEIHQVFATMNTLDPIMGSGNVLVISPNH